jgi:hypothetical protein
MIFELFTNMAPPASESYGRRHAVKLDFETDSLRGPTQAKLRQQNLNKLRLDLAQRSNKFRV